ncbi:HlyD family efflux transporter periplasmic adaptor subunit [Bradyrhizobium sp. ISRA443]|uniref:efflux RND transporter periplasmic adaptor subunit n=1 Tax=unclassified Bradyrhizobium TaxID=2631580 RepID=UPI002478A4A0|nr:MULTISPECIES: HlyD family efflux transporter periplasmic adaptor subunit [unclassified Bradyrhizobium]WGR94889.1 HlyD family efflux transporter periplasmic adaptor subunit [Bradyrhizobium sp. ISRA435]WGR99748.1 HlyD family efflux transporter periplasmic adaptor subunit [Bradyrhizobium sp. ISRA436]WGS06638.1 HlyD family efflux transporter periplasmic adaptor subunit [Bradyrhizobium sp. ISRA437]WGS13522.1 HlyD family efflux transporter periplasmic adaptor subunit [Bradyrhizobium sp. ISRA443]
MTPCFSRCSAAAALLLLATQPALAADNTDALPKGVAVTVLKAAKSCFDNIVEVSGVVMARNEQQVRPDRFGLKVAEVMADPGDAVTAGQQLARLTDGSNAIKLTAPVAGTISASTAIVGAPASAKGEALFTIITRSEYDLVGMVPTRDITKVKADQTARVSVLGAGEIDGKVRLVAPTVEPNSQLGQVFIALATDRRLLVNSSGRARIKTGQSCGVAVPLTAILYSTAGTVVQVVRRDRVETRRVETGLMSAGQVEIRDGVQEGEIVVARAGALLREGDPVRPVPENADAK